MPLKLDEKAPAFTMLAVGSDLTDETEINLNDYKGKKVVLYFYPKDLTPGCTTQAIDFTALSDDFKATNTVVIGVSKDPIKKHLKFIEKKSLNVILGADEDQKVIDAYDIWQEKKFMGRTYMGIVRSTFLIDSEGVLRQSWTKVRVKEHAQTVLDAANVL
jgi:peroxiredoxin Q/BCP